MKKICSILAALLLVCSCSGRAQDASSDMAKVFADAGLRLLSQTVSPRDFSLPLVSPSAAPAEAETQSLGALKGKVVFLNFWATWCGPCRAEMPSMQALYDRYREEGLEILAVNCQEGQQEILAFMKNNGLSFPAALDSDGKVSQAYGIQAIPASFLINREGKIISRVVGSINWDTPEIRAAMEQLLK